MLKVKDKYDYRRELCEALRSGKYKQAQGNPDEGTGWKDGAMCVLGLFEHLITGKRFTGSCYDEINYSLAKKLDFNCTDLWEKNDNGWTFLELADWIEQQS